MFAAVGRSLSPSAISCILCAIDRFTFNDMYLYTLLLIVMLRNVVAAREELKVRDNPSAFERGPTVAEFWRRAFHACAWVSTGINFRLYMF